MCKRIFVGTLLVIFLFSTASSLAKPARKNEISLRDKVDLITGLGISYSEINITSSAYGEASFEKRNSTRTGGVVWVTSSVAGEWRLMPHLAISLGLEYGRTGMYMLGKNIKQEENIKVEQESFMMPISATYYTGEKGGGLRLSLGAKPSYAFVTNYYGLEGGKDSELKENKLEEGDELQKFTLESMDLVVIGGLAYRFPNGLEAGASIGLGLLERRIGEAKRRDTDGEQETWRSTSKQLYIGYNFAKLFNA